MTLEEEEALFTRENVEKIHVPDIVVEDLVDIIEEKLKKSGMYFRIAHRVKAVDSMVDKMRMKQYGVDGSENEHRKLQDLVGLRIILYYSDDMRICMNLLDTLFSEPGEWETSENTDYEFRAMKTNGVFRMPSYLWKSIENPVLQDYIDDTFEIQVRTNAFEGWHEIEHDMRYKGTAFVGEDSEGLARKMNSILATFELCDDTIVSVMEDLGHRHYKNGHWDNMLRCHYRLTFTSERLSPEIAQCFAQDQDLAKIFYKFPRFPAIRELWNDMSQETPPLTLDRIVEVVNDIGPRNESLYRAIEAVRSRQEKPAVVRRHKFEPFKPLGRYKVFQAQAYLNTANIPPQDAFRKASDYIYSWVHSRFGEVFPDLPEETDSFYGMRPGYLVEVTYRPQEQSFQETTTHLDTRIPNRTWISTASITRGEDGRLLFRVDNAYAEPEENYRDPENILFSRPNFYGEIADNIGLIDGERMRESVRRVSRESAGDFLSLLSDPHRTFPVVVFITKDGAWADEFDMDYFAYLVGYYTHVKQITDEETAGAFAKHFDLDPGRYQDSITIIFPDGRYQTSYKEDIQNASFEVIKVDRRKYWNEKGCRAFRRQLIATIREENIRGVAPAEIGKRI